MHRFITILSVFLLIISGCSSNDAGSASVTTAQSKALSKINNVQGKHNSATGSSLALQGIKTMSSVCHQLEYTTDFEGNYVPPQTIDCSQTIDLSSFGNESIQSFTTTGIMISKRSDTGKKMLFYSSNEYSAYFLDAKFYKDDYYSDISNNGSFLFDYTKSDGSGFYYVMYIWGEDDNVSIDISEGIATPKLSQNLTNISFGNKDDLCSISMEFQKFCKIYVNAYNETDQKYDQYTASLEQLMNQAVDDIDPTKLTFDLMNLNNQKIGFLKLDMRDQVFSVVDLSGNPFK